MYIGQSYKLKDVGDVGLPYAYMTTRKLQGRKIDTQRAESQRQGKYHEKIRELVSIYFAIDTHQGWT